MSRLSVFIVAGVLALALPRGFAETADDAFIKVYRLIQEADHLRQAGQSDQALVRYDAAEEGLKRIQKTYPQWNEKIIKFRLGYIAEKAGPLRANRPPGAAPAPSRSTLAAPATAPTVAPSAAPVVSSGVDPRVEAEMRALREQVRQLEADRAQMDARLKEALTAQPAAADPKELERARNTIRSLEKERELLRVALENEKAGKSKTSTEDVAAARKALEVANAKLVEQERVIEQMRRRATTPEDRTELASAKERSTMLAAENEVLKRRVQELEKPADAAKSELERLRRELAEARTELAARKADYDKLLADQRRLTSELETAQNAVRSSQQSAQRMERELEEVRGRLAKAGSDTNAPGMFTRMRLRGLQRDKERLEKELAEERASASQREAAIAQIERDKAALKKQLDAVGATLPSRQEEAQRLKQLEQERDELKKQLKEARSSAQRRTPKSKSQPEQTEQELAALRARIQVLEAQKQPYTSDELALFRRPEPGAAAAPTPRPAATAEAPDASPEPGGRRNLPAAAGPIVMEANRAFAARRFAEAESKYREVLKMDERNVFTLANLGAILTEQARYAEAEAMLTKALAEDSRDGFSLSLLGRVKFQQNKFDEALESLSLAAQIDPKNAETQNYLGITLSQKGQRVAAEAALRNAVRLSPNYASAHHNLAIIYATQDPPFIEMARWHYDKAVASGHTRNAELEARLEAPRTASTTTRN